MKPRYLAFTALFVSPCFAQTSSITIYGIIDAGITRYSSATVKDAGSGTLWKMDTGVAQASRLGFRGEENLGGGNKAVFTLENGFNVDDGTAGQGGQFSGVKPSLA